MPSIWDIMRAVRGSDLPATDRHILMTLTSLADPDTGVIPYQFTPSLTELARYTGLGRSTIARRLTVIEKAGWLTRTAPPKVAAWRDKERNSYTLAVPVPTSPRAGLVPERDQSTGPAAGPVLVPERDGTSPAAGPTSPAAGHEVPDLKTLKTTTTSSTTNKPRKQPRPRKPKPPREDVDRICTHLADRIEGNGSKRPDITDEWRKDARLLLDEKRPIPVTVDKVIALIDWCQKDPFWRSNVRSMPKFRAQYDALRLKALAEYEAERKRENGGDRNGHPAPARNAAIPAAERCPNHRGQRKDNCSACRADELAARNVRRPA